MIAVEVGLGAPVGARATVLALGMAGGLALSGVLYANLGGRAYAAMALAAALGGGVLLATRRWLRS
jgi:hypothetical protein